MDVRRYFNRKCFALLVVIGFVTFSPIYDLLTYGQRHNTAIREIGRFNQRTPPDVSSFYESQPLNSTSTVDVLQALRNDGFSPLLLSKFSENRSATRAKTHRNLVTTNSSTKPRVPNIVHYVFMGYGLTFTFVNYLSFLSVEQFIKPDQILVHGVDRPVGHWWNLTVDQVKNIYHVKRPYMDTAPNGEPLRYAAHAADYIRLDALLREYLTTISLLRVGRQYDSYVYGFRVLCHDVQLMMSSNCLYHNPRSFQDQNEEKIT